MDRRLRLLASGALFMAALSLLGASVLPCRAQEARQPTKRALLIGINDYKSESISDLAGCVNDIESMARILAGKFDFEPEDILLLRDAEATHAGIIAAIESHLIEPSAEGDIVLLHYSGHGSRMIDNSGDELDGMDETIVPHDSRTPGVFDISDDEINGLMLQLSARTPHVVFILDSCHSGSASRAAELGNTVRQIPPDTRPPPPPVSSAAGKRGLEESEDDFRLPGSNYVLISGCRAGELSNETAFEGERHGALTFFLERALRAAAGEDVTYRDIMERVRADVSARHRKQHPQLEGTGVDDVVFGVERISPKPYVLVEPKAEGAVEIGAGKLFGLKRDATLDVFPAGTKNFDTAAATGRVKVTVVGPLSAKGVVESGAVEAHSRAVLDAVRPPDFYIGVFFENENLSPTLASVKAALADHESVEIVENRAAAQIRIRETPSSILLEGRDLERLSALDNGREDTVSETVDAVAHWGRWFAILAIDNPSPEFGIDLSMVPHGSLEALPEPEIVEAKRATPREVLPDVVADGSWVTIRATNSSGRDLYVVVLDLTSHGEIVVLYPRADITEPLPTGKSLELTIPAWVPEGQDSVVDWVKVIATSDPIPADIFKLAPAARGARSAGPGDEDSLSRFLRSWAQGGTRDLGGGGFTLAPVPTKGWAVAHGVLRVERK